LKPIAIYLGVLRVKVEEMKAEYLLTGANGFIGQHLLKALEALNQPLLILNGRRSLDLTQPEALEVLPPVKTVIHLAGAGNPTDFDSDPAQSWRSNLSGTLNLLNWAKTREVEEIILASTYVYGAPQHLPVAEDHPVNPPHAYPRSKYLCEQMLQQFVQDAARQGRALRGTVLRIFNVYGPGQSEQMLIPTIISQLGQPVLQLRDPAPRRDFVHVSDLVDAVLAALQRQAGEAFEVINIGSGQSLSVAELVTRLCSLAGVQPELNYAMQPRPGEVNDVVADIGKAGQMLGWQPQISLEDGLRDLLQRR